LNIEGDFSMDLAPHNILGMCPPITAGVDAYDNC